MRRLQSLHHPEDLRRDLARLAPTSRQNAPVLVLAPARAPHQVGESRRSLSPTQIRLRGSEGDNCHSLGPGKCRYRGWCCHRVGKAKSAIPIDRRRNPAGSCMSGFRTPDGIRKPSSSRSLAGCFGLLENGQARREGGWHRLVGSGRSVSEIIGVLRDRARSLSGGQSQFISTLP